MKKTGLFILMLLTLAFFPLAVNAEIQTIKGETDVMTVDPGNKKIVFSTTVTRNDSKAAVVDWGQRGQAWIGCKGGSQADFFIFTTDVPRPEIDQAIRKMGVKFTNQLAKQNWKDTWKSHKDLKETTTSKDFLDGDPAIVMLQFEKDGKTVQVSMESLIDEKIEINQKNVLRPHTPHYVYHGTGEAIEYPSGCIVCPSDCFGGLITDNRLPILTYDSWYKINWDRMPPVGSKAQVILQF